MKRINPHVIICLFISTLKCWANDCEFIKIKYNNLNGYEYKENCFGGPDTQNALLGSGEVLNCGVDGQAIFDFPTILFRDPEPGFLSNMGSLCMNVGGVDSVVASVGNDMDSFQFAQDLTNETNLTRFCFDGSEVGFGINQVRIFLQPMGDGSVIAVKNMRLTLCRYME